MVALPRSTAKISALFQYQAHDSLMAVVHCGDERLFEVIMTGVRGSSSIECSADGHFGAVLCSPYKREPV
ncbi:hypothetical protein N7465_009618 [Penicillium sp. CMV-2018d]|nr:hypothetical protein N7465_009618 [Penicillium sp. CMV-2018d]